MREMLILELIEKYEYDCLQDTDLSLMLECPFYKANKDGHCCGKCNHKKYFEMYLDKMCE